MISIELTREETNVIVQMISGATVPLREAEKGLVLLAKFKEAIKE